MLLWAWKSLFEQHSTLVGSSLGIAGVFVLVLFFDAVFRGESEQIVAYPAHMDPDVWVMQTGVGNMHMATSFIWDWKKDVIAAMPEVEQVTPILYTSGILDAGDRKLFAFIVGLLPGDERAGPWAMTAGRHISNHGEVIIPDVVSRISGVGIGDSVRITDHYFRVVGLSHGTYSSANPVIFVPFEDLEAILSSSGTYSYLLVDAKEGTNPAQLVTRIKREVRKVNVLTNEELVRNDFALAMQMGVEIIFMMRTICSVLAALIVAFSVYSLVARKQREVAIIKALGGRRLALIGSVVFQSIIMVLLGYLFAVVFALLVIPQISLLVPQLTLVISHETILQVGLVAMLVTLIGAVIPTSLMLRLDPALAYKV